MVSIHLKSVERRYKNLVAVDRVSLDIAKGELFFLLGPSGCGKTTILRMIAGFCPLDSGQIYFDDRPMNEVPPHRRNAVMVFQSYALWPHYTVRENVQYGLDVRGVPRAEKRRLVDDALDMVRMLQCAERKPNQLSGGQQQRVAIARALINDPIIVLADEPTGEVDSQTGNEIFDYLRKMNKQFKKTFVIVTHDTEYIKKGDKIFKIHDGKIVA